MSNRRTLLFLVLLFVGGTFIYASVKGEAPWQSVAIWRQ